jgi:hypothetical protein
MSETLWDIWESGQYVGDDFSNARVTIQKAVLKKFGPWRSLVFAQDEPQYELPRLNLRSIRIDNRHQSDAATMTLTMVNQIEPDLLANLDENPVGGPTPRQQMDLAQPGYYTYRRGITPESVDRFGHDVDPLWVDMFIPNRVIRTFQGYGTDGAPNPWDDTKLILTGTWLIDKVDYKTDGSITIQCRDALKLAIEQRLYPPIIPVDQYPLEICADYTDTTTETFTSTTEIHHEGIQGGNVAKILLCSDGYISGNTPWYGCNASVYGHRESHAFDGNTSTYWLSMGNNGPNELWSFEWIGGRTFGEPVNKVRIKPKWGGYKYFIAVMENGKWVDGPIVPYGYWTGPAYPNGSNKPYVKTGWVPKSEAWFEIELPRVYNADQVRIIFTNLQNSGLGSNPYRAALYEFEVLADIPPRTEIIKTEGTREIEFIVPGNIADYTDIVKVLAAWSGFYWPWGQTDQILENWLTSEDLLTLEQVAAGFTNQVGRVWGDFAYSGAFPVDPPCIPASFWDNKSVMDGINQIKEILGFICYADATGGIVWRMPNIWRTGNFISGFGFIGQDSIREIDETKVLIDYGVQIDDANLRSEIHVVSAEDPTLYTSIRPGWAEGEVVPSAVDPQGDLALLGGQDRIMLVPNYPFISQAEVDKFAYLVSLWIHWSYRKSSIRIPGNPAFEPDDQVRVYERITEESYIHYIQGVSSTMDLDKGTWYLDVDTHWLGNGPDQTWVVNTYQDMPAALYAYLRAIGEITEDGDPNDLPPDFDPNFDIPDFPDDVPRLDQDLGSIFPDPPTVQYPYDDSWSDKDIADNIGSGYVTPPTNGSGGTVNWRSEAWRYAYWGARGSDLVTTTFMYADPPPTSFAAQYSHPNQTNSVRTTVPRASLSAWRLVAKAFVAQQYNVLSCAAYAGKDRKIAGTNTYSAHAWGLAMDVNPFSLGNSCCTESWSSWYARPDSPAFYAAIQDITNIRTNSSNTRVFGWGGFWKTKKDYMHIEIVCTRTQIQEGVHQG